MTEKRIQFNTIVQNQLPAYVREDFPLISEFLKQYYISQEFQGAPADIIQNIDQYIKLNETTGFPESVVLRSDLNFDDTTIFVDLILSPTGTDGFPDSYGLLKIDDEIITYTGKTNNSFTGCVRGFSGITDYTNDNNPDELVFSTSVAVSHSGTQYSSRGEIVSQGAKIENLSVLFLKEFLLKTKNQFLPGLENRDLFDGLNQNIFIKQAKDFYSTRGTDRSFEILFKSLYNEDVKIVRPSEYLFTPSFANYEVVRDLVVESIEGDPLELENSVLFQDEYRGLFSKAYAPITAVEKIVTGIGQTYYRMSFDSGYNKDLIVDGALYGGFLVHPKTRIIGQVSAGATTLDVDSTVGFASTGELMVKFSDETFGEISYSSKSLTQFYGCTGIGKTILDKSSVGINTYAYGKYFSFSNVGTSSTSRVENLVKIRINNIISSIDYQEDTVNSSVGDSVIVKTLGSRSRDYISKNWFYNVASKYQVESISLLDSSTNTYRLNLKSNHYFKIGDKISITGTDNIEKNSTVVEIINEKSLMIRDQGSLSLTGSYFIKRKILKGQSNVHPSVRDYTANVQNVYTTKAETTETEKPSKILISSNSIPYYVDQPLEVKDRSVTISGTFSGDNLTIPNHGFWSGDAVYYIPEKTTRTITNPEGQQQIVSTVVSSLFEEGPTGLYGEGLYYVKKVDDNTIKLARNRSNIYNSIFISFDSVTVSNNKLQPYELRLKAVKPQKLLREISSPILDGNFYETEPGFNGILINGVEILNYKSTEEIYYGKINEIEVTAPGSGYDVINPPTLKITDSVGTAATGNVSISGSLEEVRILDPGFDYVETPKVIISGGNGSGANVSVTMKSINHEAPFFSDVSSGKVAIGSQSTIGFSTYHKFRNGEQVIYETSSQQSVGGLSTYSSYFVSYFDDLTVKLHQNQSDAISGINTITLTSYGIGEHKLKSVNKKLIVDRVNVISGGSGYENKRRSISSSGISTYTNQITINDHDYKSGEIVVYNCQGTPISGLSTNTEYYVTKIDNNRFRLSNVGNSNDKDFYYRTKQYVNIDSVGSGTHIFNYPEITVSLVGKIGISSIGTKTFEAEVQPIFRGNITSVNLSNQGVGYGSSEIINFEREPSVTLVSGTSAQLYPVVNDGKITEVLVLNPGRDYDSIPDLILTGDGTGAVLTPVVSNGQLISVKVIETGIGYDPSTTFVTVVSAGSGVEFKTRIQRWKVNLFQKNFNNFVGDDGFIAEGINRANELQYCHLYAPRKLRESIFSLDQSGKTLYGSKDLTRVANLEITSKNHSPIIGWAYDGHPIYGPYGYSTKSGGIVKQMRSGYTLNSSRTSGPPTSIYPLGFFVEDYTYNNVSDDSVLDENNGRFCVTPEYPNGTYAYFATLDTLSVDTAPPFLNYKRPVFPYLIGNSFKGVPNKFNYDYTSNQDDYDINSSNWLRNTDPYNLINGTLRYDYLNIPNDLNQKSEVTSILAGGIDSVGIITGGINYKINDSVVFDNTNTSGSGSIAKVSGLLGKSVNSISVATSSITGVEIYPADNLGEYSVICDNPHNFKDGDVVTVTGLSTTSSKIEGSYSIGIGTTATIALVGFGTISSGVGSVGVTGIVTFFNVGGNLANLRENDILNIGLERVKILNIDYQLSRIRVLRSINGISSSHPASTVLYEDPRKLTINPGFKTTYTYRQNKQIYFNPVESVGLGTISGVGIGTTIFLANPGAGITQIFIPTKTLYLKNHKLETGDEVTYSSNGGNGIIVQDQSNVGFGTTLADGQKLFVAKVNDDLIGLSTVRVGLGTTGTFVGIASTTRSSTTLYFSGIGTGVYHSIKTNYQVITGEINRNLVTVSTAQTHGLQTNDSVDISVNPSISTSFTVKYSDYARKTLINPQEFSSLGINTSTNTITIDNHGFESGQKVLHTSPSPSQGLNNNFEYFVVKVDDNNFKLSNNYYESTSAKPSVVGILSASSGTVSLINPPIKVYKDSTISFDLSDSSLSHTVQSIQYPAFELNFYLDENFTQIYDKTQDSEFFEVQKIGTVGVSNNAKVTLTVNENTPTTLFYKLDPVFDSNLPITKSQASQDDEVVSNNRILSENSIYNGSYKVKISSATSFTYSLNKKPENSSYISTTSSAVISYETDSLNAFGAISKVDVKDSGKNYNSLPGITTVISDFGSGAVLEPFSSSIGKIKNIKIKDIGFDFSSDNTVRPSSAIPQVIKIEPLSSFKSIGITSVGVGYNKAPKLLVFDGKTKSLIKDVDLRYNLGDSEVTIFKNTYGITNIKPTILPVQNTNGVGIGSIFYNQSTKDVTVTLAVGFSTANIFPFSVNDRVLIENVSVGLGSTGKGFNSENYNYTLFTLTSVDENRGGIGSVTYNLSGIIGDGEIVGKFDALNSSGRIIPEKYFPVFDPILTVNDYFKGEVVRTTSSNNSGIVESWDSKNSILKISSKENFIHGEIIEGLSSKTQGISSSILNFESRFTVSPTSKVERGWKNIYGFLNDNLQRIQDSFYYQKFSYSLKSRVDFDSWDNVVSSLNHTLGFKKFSDYQLESNSQTDMNVGLSTDVGYFDVVTDLTEFVNLNCVYDFDLVRENSINFGGGIISDEIIFANRVLTDYEESIGNRVLSIDDLSSLFNSNPRSTAFSVVNTFSLSDIRVQKYITFVTDKRFTAQRQLLLVDLIHDGAFAYINQYGRVETTYDQGSFDFTISGTEGQLLFYPTKYTINDYNVTCLSYNIDDNLLGTGSTTLGGVALIDTDSVSLSSGISTTIVGIASTYSAVKILVEITPDINYNEFEFTEINVVHDGTNIELLEYGQLKTSPTSYSTSGLGTYYPYFNGPNLNIDFIPNSGVGIGTTGVVNIIQVGLANSSYSGIGTLDLKHARIEARTTSIASSVSPGLHTVASYPNDYDAAYFIVQAVDTTNNNYQLSEVIVVDNYVDTSTPYDTYDTEFGIIETSSGIGTIGSRISSDGTVELTFTPNPNIDAQVKVYMNALRHQDDARDIIDFNNGTIETFFSDYTGTERDIKRSFELKHKTFPIFERYFDGSSTSIVNIDSNSITVPNHFFVTGENVVYYQSGAGTTQAIGIATTTLTGVGTTDKLTPGITTSLYVVKINENTIKLASSAENALKVVPDVLDITSVGIGTSHRFVSTNQNAKVLLSLDNIIQSPIVATAVTTTLADQVFTTDDVIKFSGITSFFGSDLIRINDEILKIEGVGIGSTNGIRVRREWLGTKISGYSTGTLVTKVVGNYNIVDNILTFSEAPYGNTPLGTSTNPPDERDWIGISTSSYFHGRSFMRSGVVNTSNETYYKNYVLDDISSEFDGSNNIFTLKSNRSDVTGISTENAIILVNDVFQGPGAPYDYTLTESVGVTSITFTGTATSITSDVNTSSLPVGGVIVSVGSTEGFGYQPLVSAGGTAIVSSAGTIQSISIANTGSGYRSSDSYEILTKTSSIIGIGSTSIYLNNENSIFEIINLLNSGSNCKIGVGTFITSTTIVSTSSTFVQIGIGSTSQYEIPTDTSVSVNISNPQLGIVNVSVANSSVGVATITHVGFATVIGGNISTSITLTNPGSAYTTSNPPFVLIEDPKSYSDIELVYSSESVTGFGTGATIDIVVGQGSSVIDFEIRNTGYGYKVGEILTIPTGGLIGIPSTFGFKEFQVSIQDVFTDEFTGWSIGELEVFDNFDELFDGETRSFQLKKGGIVKSIVAAKGSNIVVQDTLLVFINDILQVPGEGYTFNGGSILTFTEAPKGPSADGTFSGDTSKIIFYRGSGAVDVVSREILETVKIGDELTVGYDPSVGQTPDLQEGPRTVTLVNSTDSVNTDPYYGPGNTENETLLRPVVWCRQTEDKIIDGKEVGKDRELYEPNINHFAYLIKNVGIGSTVIYVDNIRPFFNPQNENDVNLDFQNTVTMISQNERSGAIGTAVVSGLGTISSVIISDGGVGYTTAVVSFGSTIGVGTITSAFGSVIIGAAGTVTGIAITNPGVGYTSSNPPQVLISLPIPTVETNTVSKFTGDSGIIVGFGTTTSGSDLQIVFDLYIPKDSFMRDGSLVGSAVTISEISTNDYFIIYDSNIGLASTSIISRDSSGNSIGIGTRFVDNVYQVKSVSVAESTIIGIGTTAVKRVSTVVTGFGYTTGGIYTTSNYIGNYSWGKIELNSRLESNEFTFYGDRGVGGITTSSIVQRTKPLRYKNYSI